MKINWFITILTYLIALALITVLLYLGFNYIYNGYGLHPYIAFPLTAIISLATLHMAIKKVAYGTLTTYTPIVCKDQDYYVAPKNCS